MYGDSQSTSTAPAAEAAAPSVISSPAGRRWLPANRWARRALYGVAGLLGLWALGWLAVPPVLKWQGEKIASEQLGRAAIEPFLPREGRCLLDLAAPKERLDFCVRHAARSIA